MKAMMLHQIFPPNSVLKVCLLYIKKLAVNRKFNLPQLYLAHKVNNKNSQLRKLHLATPKKKIHKMNRTKVA